jgi:CRISPR-associated endonuclease/helicase Cas3
MDMAMMAEGEDYARRGQANQAIIGLPDDASWNDPARFVLYDEDSPSVHRTLMAQTRLGEDSVAAIPLWQGDGFISETQPGFELSKQWFQRGVSLSRKGVVRKLQAKGVPEGWKKSSFLRNCFPLDLDDGGCWKTDATVRLDVDLGVVFENKEEE